jgi:hypothetical protein
MSVSWDGGGGNCREWWKSGSKQLAFDPLLMLFG